MNLKNLSDKNLLNETKKLAAKEREITTQVIKYLAEVDRRKLFADLGFSSLFKYCTDELKMSEVQDLWGEDRVPPKEKIKPVSKTQHQITLTIDDETLEILKELKETMVYKGVKDLSGVVKELCRQKQKEKPIKERANNGCEFTCAGNGGGPQVCGPKFGLSIDHIRPYSLGGTHELSNLRLLCHQHHARESFKVFRANSHCAKLFK